MSRAVGAYVLAGLVALGLVVLAVDGGDAHGDTSRVATLNVYRGNPGQLIRADVRRAMRLADVVMLQEVYPGQPAAAVRRVMRHHPRWRSAKLRPTELRIMWDTREFTRARPAHLRRLSPSYLPTWRLPARWLGWVTLRHRTTGQLVTMADVHPHPSYCRPRPPAPALLRDELTAEHWRDVATWTRARRVPVVLAGDFNCSLSRTARPWWPGRVLRSLYRFDHAPGSVDRVLISRSRGHPVGIHRWSFPVYSDHRLVIRAMRWRSRYVVERWHPGGRSP